MSGCHPWQGLSLPLHRTASRLHIVIWDPFAMAELAIQQDSIQQVFQGPPVCRGLWSSLFYAPFCLWAVSHAIPLPRRHFSLFPPVLLQPVPAYLLTSVLLAGSHLSPSTWPQGLGQTFSNVNACKGHPECLMLWAYCPCPQERDNRTSPLWVVCWC